MTAPAVIRRLFDWKVRGVRWIEIIGVICVAAMIFSVYIAKAAAARESALIGELESDIAETRQRVRLLRAELSRLEQPSRLEALSQAAGLGPVDVHRQATVAQLTTLEPVPPAPVVVAPEVAVPEAPAAPPVSDEAAQ